MFDGLFNATFNPAAAMSAGAVASAAGLARTAFGRKAAAAAAPAFPVKLISSVKDFPYAYSAHRS